VQLNRGARPLLELQTKNQMEIVLMEIVHNKIYLDTTGRVAITADGPPESPQDAGPGLDDL